MSSLACPLLGICVLWLGSQSPVPPAAASGPAAASSCKLDDVPESPPGSREPFTARATVILVPHPEAVGSTPTGEQDHRDRPSPLEQAVSRKHLHQFLFDGPAHFPLPRFGLTGEPLCGEGVVIYEGMRLLVAPDGRYEVSFTATTPAMPVTLRLQITLCGKGKDRDGFVSLTLPPIRIVPARDFQGNYLGDAWFVQQAGYSAQLRQSALTSLSGCSVTRQGSARFGSWPEGINEFSRLPR